MLTVVQRQDGMQAAQLLLDTVVQRQLYGPFKCALEHAGLNEIADIITNAPER